MSRHKIKKLYEHLDFMVEMTEENRQKFRKRLLEVIEEFEIDKSPFEKTTQHKIDDIKQTVENLYQSLAMIEVTKNKMRSKNYKIKNNVLLEMLENNTHDKAFIIQMEQAKPETRELINSLISTMEMP
jgi:hypothetical protein